MQPHPSQVKTIVVAVLNRVPASLTIIVNLEDVLYKDKLRS